MCFCLSGYMVNWWTNRSPLAFSFTALYPVFFRQDGNCLVDFLCIVFFDSVTGVEYSLNLFAVSLSDLLFLLFGFLSYSLITSTPVWISASPSPCCPLPHIFPCSRLFVCGFWAMLSSPTVILQPYGLPVYPQTTTCYPSIVQVNSHFTL